MGSGASSEKVEAVTKASVEEVAATIKALPAGDIAKLKEAIAKAGDAGANSVASAALAKNIPTGPTLWLTSTAFVTDSQWVRFIQVMMARKGVLEEIDSNADAKLEHLVEKYAPHIKKLKVTYINDAGYHRPKDMMAAGRMECPETGKDLSTHKVGNKDGHKGRGPGSWFFWDQGLHDVVGIPQENIKMLQILEKPWLFNTPGRIANSHTAQPNVAELDPKDQEAYFAALQLTQDAYDSLKEDPPKVGAEAAEGTLPGCPKSGLSCASELAEISTKLNAKYEAALNKWCEEHIDGVDVICGQGGEVVMLNMAWQCNQALAD
eukprot:TRINITY_DN12040_c0_g1_i6.p1 TRINITY_DN12040_c0_g1~~TRINITY_DN12040_c0_g1_i6.p1  ORF type:complete len:321 (+),score=73.24 TRINITY_DN12040_c0_g1_i6:49-1011(+)